ncbi:MAG: glutamine synthetase family protein [Gammaproteobacteria bacterium]|nr:glutamine synthetase family protein [Gammaproteobacteria bacterium]
MAAASSYLSEHPDTEVLDLLIPDINGIARGKKISADLVAKSFDEGVYLPRSLYALDICGGTVEATRLGIATGDMDYVCRPEAKTLRPVPWTSVAAAQCMMEMYEADGKPFFASPRHVLRRLAGDLAAAKLFPTVAVELEFYLFHPQLDAAGMPQLLTDPVSGKPSQGIQVYSMDDLDNFAPFIDTVREYCSAQSVAASAAIAEYAPGQFEINLQHKSDPVSACDDALYLKRIIRIAARKHGMNATFMAKPVADQVGSGMHIHASLLDEHGDNVFAKNPASLSHAIGGLQATMADAMVLFAPHANSFRRYQENLYVPMAPTWGYNNRSVALRIPSGSDDARRIEHRVAGADANPYLVMGAVLAGILHGHRQQIEADEPIDGDAVKQRPASLPLDWLSATQALRQSRWAEDYFGATFIELYSKIKNAEYSCFNQSVPPLDIQWYFQTV